jgi:AcrR family transcriptional regulator
MANPKKARLIQFNRENILDAAKMLFQENGLAQTTMDDIAKQADCSKSTIYMYFTSKDDIYHAIIKEHMVMLKEGVTIVKASYTDFRSRYFALCQKLAKFKKQYPLYFESVLGTISVAPADLARDSVLHDIYRIGEETNVLLCEIFQEARHNKEVQSDIDPLSTAFILWVSISGVITMAYNKAAYIQLAFGMEPQAFMQKGFDTLLQSVLPHSSGRRK